MSEDDLIGELSVSLWDRGLVGNGEHSHPTPQNAQRVDRVERLRATIYLCDG